MSTLREMNASNTDETTHADYAYYLRPAGGEESAACKDGSALPATTILTE